MYFTWNFLARIFVIWYYYVKFMWLISFHVYHNHAISTWNKIAVQVICIYHILDAGNLTGFVRSRSLLPWDFVFLRPGPFFFFFFSKHILFCLRFWYLTINQCYLLIYRDLFSTYFLLLDKIVILTFNLPKSFDNFWIYFTDWDLK